MSSITGKEFEDDTFLDGLDEWFEEFTNDFEFDSVLTDPIPAKSVIEAPYTPQYMMTPNASSDFLQSDFRPMQPQQPMSTPGKQYPKLLPKQQPTPSALHQLQKNQVKQTIISLPLDFIPEKLVFKKRPKKCTGSLAFFTLYSGYFKEKVPDIGKSEFGKMMSQIYKELPDEQKWLFEKYSKNYNEGRFKINENGSIEVTDKMPMPQMQPTPIATKKHHQQIQQQQLLLQQQQQQIQKQQQLQLQKQRQQTAKKQQTQQTQPIKKPAEKRTKRKRDLIPENYVCKMTFGDVPVKRRRVDHSSENISSELSSFKTLPLSSDRIYQTPKSSSSAPNFLSSDVPDVFGEFKDEEVTTTPIKPIKLCYENTPTTPTQSPRKKKQQRQLMKTPIKPNNKSKIMQTEVNDENAENAGVRGNKSVFSVDKSTQVSPIKPKVLIPRKYRQFADQENQLQ